MKIIGVTGGTGSGKSTVSEMLRERGGVVIDADAITRELQKKGSPMLQKLAEAFGGEIISENGNLDRKKLGKIVFEDKNKLLKINSIVHGEVGKEMKKRVIKAREGGALFAVLDVPIPVEEGFFDTADVIWAVVANNDLRVERLMARSELTEEEAEQRIGAQMTNLEYEEIADVVIVNEEDREALEKKVVKELQKLFL